MNREELEAASGISARNIRFLIAEGLLPPPVGTGRGARYTDEHLRILRAYVAAKERGVSSLDVIRREIAAGDEKVTIPVMAGMQLLATRSVLGAVPVEELLAALRTKIEEFKNGNGETA